eukprot:6213012-Pleurochrysis_carterae.AAC.1
MPLLMLGLSEITAVWCQTSAARIESVALPATHPPARCARMRSRGAPALFAHVRARYLANNLAAVRPGTAHLYGWIAILDFEAYIVYNCTLMIGRTESSVHSDESGPSKGISRIYGYPLGAYLYIDGRMTYIHVSERNNRRRELLRRCGIRSSKQTSSNQPYPQSVILHHFSFIGSLLASFVVACVFDCTEQ